MTCPAPEYLGARARALIAELPGNMDARDGVVSVIKDYDFIRVWRTDYHDRWRAQFVFRPEHVSLTSLDQATYTELLLELHRMVHQVWPEGER